MTSREVYALFSNFSQITGWHERDVSFQLAGKDSLNVLALLQFASEAYIISELPVLDPVLALDITCSSSDLYWAVACEILLQKNVLEALQLIR